MVGKEHLVNTCANNYGGLVYQAVLLLHSHAGLPKSPHLPLPHMEWGTEQECWVRWTGECIADNGGLLKGLLIPTTTPKQSDNFCL